MGTTRIEYRTLPGTRAAVGRAGTHCVIADRPGGKFGGMGLGFNGGELLALAIGGCFCNDLQALADEAGLTIADLHLAVSVDFSGQPSRASSARMTVECSLADGSDPSQLIERAKAITTIANSLCAGVPVEIAAARPATLLASARYACRITTRRRAMLGTILIILLILLLIGALPRWGYSSGWGYGPSGLLGLILIIIVILVLLGRV